MKFRIVEETKGNDVKFRVEVAEKPTGWFGKEKWVNAAIRIYGPFNSSYYTDEESAAKAIFEYRELMKTPTRIVVREIEI